MSYPVLKHGADGNLDSKIPFDNVSMHQYRAKSSYIEAICRTICGIAPWLEVELSDLSEAKVQNYFKELSKKCLEELFSFDSIKKIKFGTESQHLVELSLLALAFFHSPKLWQLLDDITRKNICESFDLSRMIEPKNNNWLLFSAMIECFLHSKEQNYDHKRIILALNQFNNWYLGDGHYSDGPKFKLDYYNSIIIHPFILIILSNFSSSDIALSNETALLRSQRYCELLERMISSNGTLPPVGRSLSYRTGLVHIISLLILKKQTPKNINLGKLKRGLNLLITRQLEDRDLYTNQWLNVGYVGHQKNLGENYITTGSLYIASLVFAPLGLHPNEDFWITSESATTSEQIINDKNIQRDYSKE